MVKKILHLFRQSCNIAYTASVTEYPIPEEINILTRLSTQGFTCVFADSCPYSLNSDSWYKRVVQM